MRADRVALERIGVDLRVPLVDPPIGGQLPRKRQRVERLCVGPPELLVPVRPGRFGSFAVAAEEQPAVLLVPPELQVSAYALEREINHLPVPVLAEDVDHEPHALDGVPGDDDAPLRCGKDVPVERQVLQDQPAIRAAERVHHQAGVFESGGEYVGALRDTSELVEPEREDHRDGVRLGPGRDGVRVGRVRPGRRQPPLDRIVGPDRQPQRLLILRRAVVLAEAEQGETVGEDGRRPGEDLSFGAEAEAPVAVLVAAESAAEVEKPPRDLQPLLAPLDAIVERRERVDRAQLRPHVDVPGDYRPVVGDAGPQGPRAPVQGVARPERDDVGEQVSAEEPQAFTRCQRNDHILIHLGSRLHVGRDVRQRPARLRRSRGSADKENQR